MVEEQRISFSAALERANNLEEMTRSSGWNNVKTLITNKIADFANRAILTGFTTMDEFNLERGKILGLRQLLADIESDIKTLQNERQRNNTNTK